MGEKIFENKFEIKSLNLTFFLNFWNFYKFQRTTVHYFPDNCMAVMNF
jgi:hypothetical protein